MSVSEILEEFIPEVETLVFSHPHLVLPVYHDAVENPDLELRFWLIDHCDQDHCGHC